MNAPAAVPAFNPLDPAFIRDPYPTYKMMRETKPIWKSMLGPWILSRYRDITATLKDPTFIHDFEGHLSDPSQRRGRLHEPVMRSLGQSMIARDPPDHGRLRGLVVRAFTARRVEEMRPRIEALVKDMLDQIVPRGRMDVIGDLSHRIPILIICEMLGIPEQDRDQFMEGFKVSGRSIEPIPMSPQDLKESNEAVLRHNAYFEGVFAYRRKHPGDDLISAMMAVRDEGDGRLSDEELCANISLLFAAGHETTANLIGNGMLALHRNPDQWKRLVDDPSLADGAVDELLRYDSSVQLTMRKASHDTTVGAEGVEVKKGEMVILVFGAGNRDPEQFENPDTLDIARKNVWPLSFGGGIHYCLGAQLAKIEAGIVFRELARRLPHIELDNVVDPKWQPTITLRRLAGLQAHWATA